VIDAGKGGIELNSTGNSIALFSNAGATVYTAFTAEGTTSYSRTSMSGDYNPSSLIKTRLFAMTATANPTHFTLSTENAAIGTADRAVFYTLKDEAGNATANNIHFSIEGGGTIDGASQFIMNADYESLEIYCTGTNCFKR